MMRRGGFLRLANGLVLVKKRELFTLSFTFNLASASAATSNKLLIL
jgi:hypothetical protein